MDRPAEHRCGPDRKRTRQYAAAERIAEQGPERGRDDRAKDGIAKRCHAVPRPDPSRLTDAQLASTDATKPPVRAPRGGASCRSDITGKRTGYTPSSAPALDMASDQCSTARRASRTASAKASSL